MASPKLDLNNIVCSASVALKIIPATFHVNPAGRTHRQKIASRQDGFSRCSAPLQPTIFIVRISLLLYLLLNHYFVIAISFVYVYLSGDVILNP